MSMDIVMKSDEQPFISAPNVRIFRQSIRRGMQTSLRAPTLEKVSSRPRGSRRRSRKTFTAKLTSPTFRRWSSTEKWTVASREIGSARKRFCSTRTPGAAIHSSNRSRSALRYDHIDHRALARKSPHLMPPTFIKEEIMDDELDEVKEEVVSVGEAALPTPKVELNMDHPEKDLIISISVYLGYTRTLQYHEIRLGRLMKITDRLELTGDHTLRDLKNAFSCPIDFSFSDDFSEKKPSFKDMAKNKWPSTMFFIHDTFYI
eukprot:NP_490695.2 SNAPc (Small Nuclear RNA Activating Complex) homolog [Caenorhabditis elegans]